MKIKTQLIALVSGVALPLILLATFVTYQLWQHQHQSFQQSFLERASAVRLALDTEFDVIFRTLRAAGDGAEIPKPYTETVVLRRFRRLLDNYPDWDAMVLTDAQGRVLMFHTRPGKPEPPLLDKDGIRQALAARGGYISNVVAGPDGRHIVFAATAISRDGIAQGLAYAAIEHSHWLELLRTHPVSPRGTLTLLDRDSTVISRTLDDAQWVGKQALPAYRAQNTGQASGAFKTKGIDGTPFYAAFSRSAGSGWVLAAGVPQDEVDAALHWQTLSVSMLALASILGALLASWRLGKDINTSMVGLLGAAHALAGKAPATPAVLPIREADTVRLALAQAHDQLQAREASLNASLDREAAARRQAESASRSKDQFLAMMGHELRNPLSAIMTATDLLGTDATPGAALNRTREIVRRQAGHLATMINDLMDVAQLDASEIVLRKTRLDLAQAAAKVLRRFEDTGRCAHLQIRTAHVPAWIEADEARIELLITCLLDNACKYTPPGGTVTIEVRGEPGSSVLRIHDTGAGIAAELAERMFDAFTQGQRSIDRAEGGLGLGLSLARKLTELHDGTIAATSAGPGHGASFCVAFPAAEAPLPEPTAPHAAVSRELVITVVEDIGDNREAMVLLLEAQGRRINEAADGPSGVQRILEGPSDVALVDIGLPGFDGLEVARRVREAPAGRRVLLIALTGYGTDADRAQAIAAGFDDFLVKPFDPDGFETVLSRGLASRNETEAFDG